MEYGIKKTDMILSRWEVLYRRTDNVPWVFYSYASTKLGAEKECRKRKKDEEVIVIS